jgi:hypothetical protein
LAVKQGLLDVVKVALGPTKDWAYALNPNVKVFGFQPEKDANGVTPLHLAAEGGNLLIATLLLQRKALVNVQVLFLQYLIEH